MYNKNVTQKAGGPSDKKNVSCTTKLPEKVKRVRVGSLWTVSLPFNVDLLKTKQKLTFFWLLFAYFVSFLSKTSQKFTRKEQTIHILNKTLQVFIQMQVSHVMTCSLSWSREWKISYLHDNLVHLDMKTRGAPAKDYLHLLASLLHAGMPKTLKSAETKWSIRPTSCRKLQACYWEWKRGG